MVKEKFTVQGLRFMVKQGIEIKNPISQNERWGFYLILSKYKYVMDVFSPK
jgi:hypothetical protein